MTERKRSINTKKLEKLITFLRDNGVLYYKDSDMELRILPKEAESKPLLSIDEQLAEMRKAQADNVIDENVEFLHSY